jgi:colanic acid/amylovoran biosynthesis glycosyltransferase
MPLRAKEPLRVAFVVGQFPSVTETFIINQVADLLDQGVHVEVFTFAHGSDPCVSSRYNAYLMSERTHPLQASAWRSRGFGGVIGSLFRILLHPLQIARALRYCICKRSLRLLFSLVPFVGRRFDVIHCHFGTIANHFLIIKEALHLDSPLITTFYGYDVSKVFKESSANPYDRLLQQGSLFFVMSNDMKRRVVARGFPEDKVKVLPVGIDVDSYPFSERRCPADVPVELVSVARFVEKKGLDDLLRALAIVKQRTRRAFRCSIVGSGQMDGQLRELTLSLGLRSDVEFKGSMKIEDIIALLPEMHIMVQPSKTAKDGDME